ncbi:septal ring lytic transglycosylase RlpA family protein [Leptothrix discophora]|uniref:septal ring lytic transglycosylase RlpA family protein n=1 Tax=Leptothrix discophora TaxID=89 RepID=UPI0034E5BFAD
MWTRWNLWTRRATGLAAPALLVLLTACGSLPPPRLATGPDASPPERRLATDGAAVRPIPVGPSSPTSPTSPAPPTARRSPFDGADGPDPNPPPFLNRIPDAVPRIEFIRNGAPNKPYVTRGESHVPVRADVPVRQVGLASWYGRKFHGQRTANGEVYDMYAMTAAHPTLPIPSYARVRNPSTGKSVIVRINDRGPFHYGRIIDLSYTAALKLGFAKGKGTARVIVEAITQQAIRTGSWRLDEPPSSGTGTIDRLGLHTLLASLDGWTATAVPAATWTELGRTPPDWVAVSGR